ncbi:B4galnt4p [Desmophyllum pertusum]|uniref:B4galnt4p n=1 Tax=Desmophyllum pertusum TaxID=174260 RepID=A0A9W9ZTY3_9CNID|nr:B4galnt4p [Desmophyllum pertusum]
MLFAASSEKLRQTSSANIDDCCEACRNAVKQQNGADDTSTAETLTDEHDFSKLAGQTNGLLNVHMWSEICGAELAILRNWPHFPYFPNTRSFISEFHRTQVPASSNNGERIFGFIHPQRSGEYYFAISSDDTSELWLSPNEDPASSEMIARVYSPKESAWTDRGDYKKYPDQISKGITLHAYKKYYIESLSKQGSGDAHVSVYWSYKNSTFEIISSKYLSSFSENNNRESIPPHARKQTGKSKIYFNHLPIISKEEYISLIPSCPYSPSFLVRTKLKQYQGVWLTMESRAPLEVFPQDDTDMMRSNYNSSWVKPNLLLDKNRVESVVDKFVNSLRVRTPLQVEWLIFL